MLSLSHYRVRIVPLQFSSGLCRPGCLVSARLPIVLYTTPTGQGEIPEKQTLKFNVFRPDHAPRIPPKTLNINVFSRESPPCAPPPEGALSTQASFRGERLRTLPEAPRKSHARRRTPCNHMDRGNGRVGTSIVCPHPSLRAAQPSADTQPTSAHISDKVGGPRLFAAYQRRKSNWRLVVSLKHQQARGAPAIVLPASCCPSVVGHLLFVVTDWREALAHPSFYHCWYVHSHCRRGPSIKLQHPAAGLGMPLLLALLSCRCLLVARSRWFAIALGVVLVLRLRWLQGQPIGLGIRRPRGGARWCSLQFIAAMARCSRGASLSVRCVGSAGIACVALSSGELCANTHEKQTLPTTCTPCARTPSHLFVHHAVVVGSCLGVGRFSSSGEIATRSGSLCEWGLRAIACGAPSGAGSALEVGG